MGTSLARGSQVCSDRDLSDFLLAVGGIANHDVFSSSDEYT